MKDINNDYFVAALPRENMKKLTMTTYRYLILLGTLLGLFSTLVYYNNNDDNFVDMNANGEVAIDVMSLVEDVGDEKHEDQIKSDDFEKDEVKVEVPEDDGRPKSRAEVYEKSPNFEKYKQLQGICQTPHGKYLPLIISEKNPVHRKDDVWKRRCEKDCTSHTECVAFQIGLYGFNKYYCGLLKTNQSDLGLAEKGKKISHTVFSCYYKCKDDNCT